LEVERLVEGWAEMLAEAVPEESIVVTDEEKDEAIAQVNDGAMQVRGVLMLELDELDERSDRRSYHRYCLQRV
jgi:hypothetical protein